MMIVNGIKQNLRIVILACTIISCLFFVTQNASASDIGYSLVVQTNKELKEKHLEGDRVTIFDNNNVAYEKFVKWEIVSGNMDLSNEQQQLNPLIISMPSSDVVIKAVYSSKTLQEDIADENNRYNNVIARASSLETSIKIKTTTANGIKNKYGVSYLESAYEYSRLANETESEIRSAQNRAIYLSGSERIRLENEIESLKNEYKMYLELKSAAGLMEQVEYAKSELDRINLDVEENNHNQNIRAIYFNHNVTGESVDEIKYINLDKDEYDYTGKEVKPLIEIITVGGKKLGNESYDITYPNDCVSEGVHSLTIELKGEYTGTITKNYIIVKHNCGEWSITKSATCTQNGTRESICLDCGKKISETIPATGHEYGAWKMFDNSQHQRVCTHDYSHVEKQPHTWDNGKVTKEATTKQKGVKTFTCAVCKGTKTEDIPVIAGPPTPIIDPGSDSQPDAAQTNIKGMDGTALGKGASAELAEKAIIAMKNDKDPKGSYFGKLQLKSTVQTKTSIKLQWKKVKGAKKYVIYGNACGKKNKMKKLATVKGKVKNFKKIAGKKVKKGTYYKFIVVAVDGNNRVVSSSKLIHVATKGGKVGNPKSIIVKAKVGKKVKAVSKVKVKKGKRLKLKVTIKPFSKKLKVKKHVAPRYESSNTKIATVNAKGIIKAKKKGKCKVYVYAQNGLTRIVTIIVK